MYIKEGKAMVSFLLILSLAAGLAVPTQMYPNADSSTTAPAQKFVETNFTKKNSSTLVEATTRSYATSNQNQTKLTNNLLLTSNSLYSRIMSTTPLQMIDEQTTNQSNLLVYYHKDGIDQPGENDVYSAVNAGPFFEDNGEATFPSFPFQDHISSGDMDVYAFLGEMDDLSNRNQSMNDEFSTTSGYGTAIAPWSVHAFFIANWLWFFLIFLAIVLLFCLPGMIIQLWCNKFYLSYKREKKLKKEQPEPIEKNNITEHADAGDIDTYQQLPLPEASPCERSEVKPTTAGDQIPPPQPLFEHPVEPLPAPRTSRNIPATQHRVDIYSGPRSPTLVPAIVPQTPPPTEYDTLSAMMQPTCIDPRSPPNTLPRTNPPLPAPIPIAEPAVVYPISTNCIQLSEEEKTWNRNTSPRMAIGNEAIIESNNTQFPQQRQSSSRPRKRIAKKKRNNKPPSRPPKPKQYKIRPSKTLSTEGTSVQSKPDEAAQKRKERSKRKSKPQKIIVDKPLENPNRERPKNKQRHKSDKGPQDRKNNPAKQTPPQSAKLKELRHREELLRQIIQGINEAEMLQRKLERTRKWTKDQKLRSVRNAKEKERRNVRDSEKAKRRSRGNKRDRPPRYEDVMSEASDARAKNKPASSQPRNSE